MPLSPNPKKLFVGMKSEKDPSCVNMRESYYVLFTPYVIYILSCLNRQALSVFSKTYESGP